MYSLYNEYIDIFRNYQTKLTAEFQTIKSLVIYNFKNNTQVKLVNKNRITKASEPFCLVSTKQAVSVLAP